MRYAVRFALTLSLLFTLAPGVSAQTWTEITPQAGSAPEARRRASAVYDPAGHRMILFGGQGAPGRFQDVWAFDLTSETWTDISPTVGATPTQRLTPSSVYDPDGHRMLMWSGQNGGTFFNDVWAFDLTTHAWSEYSPPAPMPNQRYGTPSVYDPVSRHLVTFGGFTFQGRFNDTWRFDPALDAWTDVTPAGVSPGERCLHSASYDSREHRMIMYGGQRSGPLGDIWAFDLAANTWTEFTPASSPQGRFFTVNVYDAQHHRVIIFGGSRGGAGNSNEVWLFNLHNDAWILMTPGGTPPSAREGAAGIYIESEDRMVVFGGYDGTYRNDVWSLDDLSDTVTGTPPSAEITRVQLRQNHPDPFNPSTVIGYDLPRDAQVRLAIYDARGQLVREFLNVRQSAGARTVSWDGTDATGAAVAAGTYFYELQAGDVRTSRKMVLVE